MSRLNVTTKYHKAAGRKLRGPHYGERGALGFGLGLGSALSVFCLLRPGRRAEGRRVEGPRAEGRRAPGREVESAQGGAAAEAGHARHADAAPDTARA